MLRRRRNVKILATLGPSSSSYDAIRSLVESGADAFRLNMSHGTHGEHFERYQIIRYIEADLGRPVSIVADLQGPKLRVGTFANDHEELETGQTFRLDMDESPGTAERVHLPHREIFEALEPGATLLVNDGKIRLEVQEVGDGFAATKVIAGGTISNRKGVNVPDVMLPLAALTEKDRADLEFCKELGVDWLALSFVQRASDVAEARELSGGGIAIMAKIEKPAALGNINEIIQISDAIMVARGDLGVELPAAQVPLVQKQLIRLCRKIGRPVVVATQMLESMIESPVPTRAEVSDVSNAILEGADAVMLSAESAAGEFPTEAVAMMNTIAETIEADHDYRKAMSATRPTARGSTAHAIVAAAREIANTTDVVAICCFTHSGTTAVRAARERPSVPILVLTPIETTARRMQLIWGLHTVLGATASRFRESVLQAVKISRSEGFASDGDKIVITAGVPFGQSGSTNILRIAEVSDNVLPNEG